jgi:hypothetical protein
MLSKFSPSALCPIVKYFYKICLGETGGTAVPLLHGVREQADRRGAQTSRCAWVAGAVVGNDGNRFSIVKPAQDKIRSKRLTTGEFVHSFLTLMASLTTIRRCFSMSRNDCSSADGTTRLMRTVTDSPPEAVPAGHGIEGVEKFHRDSISLSAHRKSDPSGYPGRTRENQG